MESAVGSIHDGDVFLVAKRNQVWLLEHGETVLDLLLLFDHRRERRIDVSLRFGLLGLVEKPSGRRESQLKIGDHGQSW